MIMCYHLSESLQNGSLNIQNNHSATPNKLYIIIMNLLVIFALITTEYLLMNVKYLDHSYAFQQKYCISHIQLSEETCFLFFCTSYDVDVRNSVNYL